MTLDPALLLSLLTADPNQRESQIGKLLTQQLGGANGAPDLSALYGATPPAPAQGEPTAQTAALHRELQIVDDELRRAHALLADVAAALGACSRCLGSDESCTLCVGTGAAGTSEPAPDRFAELIAPAVLRLADEEGAVDTS